MMKEKNEISETFSLQKLKVTPGDSGIRLERWLKKKLPQESYGHLQKLLRTGQVRVEGKRVKGSALLQEGQEVRIPCRGTPQPAQSVKAPFIDPRFLDQIRQAILYEDDHVLVLNKPAGLAVQGGTKTTISLDVLVRALPFPYASDLRLTHRLDKDTSGVLILAKTARDAAWVTEAFRQGSVKKTYWALVVGKPEKNQGFIKAALSKKPTSSGEKIQIDPLEGVEALTHYEVKGFQEGIAWIAFYPETGRTHQIRVHTASLGCPVLGDGKYGGRKAHPWAYRTRLQLHACQVQLPYPGGAEKIFQAPLPADISASFARLGFLS